MKKKLASLFLALCCTVGMCACGGNNDDNGKKPSDRPEHLGLYVDDDGTLMKDGKAYYGIGINYYSLMEGSFTKNYKNTRLDKVLAALETLASYDVRVIRFNLTGIYNSQDWYDFVTRKLENSFFESLDAVVKKSEELGLGLIPSFAWNSPALSDAFNEPCNKAFAQDDSKTMIWFLDFTEKVVTRYVDSPAIYGWEYGNEENLISSIPAAFREELSPPPQYFGEDSRKKRTDDDYLTYETHQKSIAYFAEVVYNADPYHRLIGNGDAAQRPYIWHWAKNQDGRDTLEQFQEMFDMTAPGYANSYSVHEYAHSDSATGDNAIAYLDGSHVFESRDFTDYFTKYLQESARTKKAVYMGETGYLSTLPGTRSTWNGKDEQHSIKVTDAILEAAYETNFPLTLLWVYDERTLYDASNHISHNGGTEHSWNENFVKGKAYLEAVKKYNKLIDEKHAAETAD